MLKFALILASFSLALLTCAALAPRPPPECYLTHDDGTCLGKLPRYRYNFWSHNCERYLFSGCPRDLWNNFNTLRECERIAYPVCRRHRTANTTAELLSTANGGDSTNTNKANVDSENLDLLEDEIVNSQESLGKFKLSKREKLIVAISTKKLKKCTQTCYKDALRSLLQ